jgi:hypothetical protein
MRTDPSSLAAEMAQVTMCFINLMGFFASPRVIAKAPTLPSREHILKHIEDFIGVLASASHSTQPNDGSTWRNSEPHVPRLREFFREWVPEQGISPEVIQIARTCLLAFGVSKPPEGWDGFEGAEDEVPIARSRATPVGEALAVAWRFISWASIFVIPAFLAAHDPGELRAELLQRIARYLEALELLRDHPVQEQDDEKGLLRLEPFALKLRTLLREWTPEQPVPLEIIQTVDTCLKAIGVLYPTTDAN